MGFPLLLLGGGLALAGTATLSRRRKIGQRLTCKATHPPLKSLVEQHREEMERRKTAVNRDLRTSLVALVSAGLAELVYPPLLLIAVPLALLSSVSIFNDAWQSWRVQRKLHSSVIDSVAIIGTLASGFYFAAILVNTLYFFGQRFLLQTEDRSSKQLYDLFGENPRSVWVSRNGAEIETAFEDVVIGDLVAVHAGESVPFDGQVAHGTATIDQHMLTGESRPQDKTNGDRVFASTLVISGKIEIRVQKTGRDTAVAQIGQALQNTLDFKSTVEARGTRMANQLTLPTLALSGLALARLGPLSATAITNCNFADIIRITIPLGVLNHIKMAAEYGILIKDGRALELLAEVDTVVFDKTGTLTEEQPCVGTVHAINGFEQDEVLSLAAAAEHRQSHPVARAIIEAAQQRGLELDDHEHTCLELGHGLRARVQGRDILIGSRRFIENEEVAVPKDGAWEEDEHARSLVFVAVERELAGVLELESRVRPETPRILKSLRDRGHELYILSGDHEQPTRRLAESLGIKHYFAETLPEDKAHIIEGLQATGRNVCFVGDGINDALAMKKARVAISLAGATTVATDTASIVLLDKSLGQIDNLFTLARGFERNMRSGLAWSILPGIAGAGAVFIVRMGIYGATSLYMLSLGAGVTNAALPLFGHKKRNDLKRQLPQG